MKFAFKSWALAMTALCASPVALADGDVATVTKVAGSDGTVVVIRQSDAFALRVQDPLFEGDRVIVRPDSTAEITALDCTVTLEASQSMMITSNICEDTAALFSTGDLTATTALGEPVGAAAPLWTLFAAASAPTAVAVDALTDGNGTNAVAPVVTQNTAQSTSP